jgi:hypothetical protein
MAVNFDMVPFVPDSGQSWLSQGTRGHHDPSLVPMIPMIFYCALLMPHYDVDSHMNDNLDYP